MLFLFSAISFMLYIRNTKNERVYIASIQFVTSSSPGYLFPFVSLNSGSFKPSWLPLTSTFSLSQQMLSQRILLSEIQVDCISQNGWRNRVPGVMLYKERSRPSTTDFGFRENCGCAQPKFLFPGYLSSMRIFISYIKRLMENHLKKKLLGEFHEFFLLRSARWVPSGIK